MKKVIGVLVTTTLLFFCGCFDYEELVVLESDLSGTIQMKFSIEKIYLDQMFAMSQEMAKVVPGSKVPESPQSLMFNKDEISLALADGKSGLTLTHHEISEVGDKQLYDMIFSFTDVNNIDLIFDALSPDEDEGNYQESEDSEQQPFLVKQDDGTYLFLRSFKDDNMSGGEDEYDDENLQYQYYADSDEQGSDDAEYDNPMENEIEEGLEQLSQEVEKIGKKVAKNKLQFSITFPGKIIESNATSTDGNTLVWKYTMEELQSAQPEQRAVIKF